MIACNRHYLHDTLHFFDWVGSTSYRSNVVYIRNMMVQTPVCYSEFHATLKTTLKLAFVYNPSYRVLTGMRMYAGILVPL